MFDRREKHLLLLQWSRLKPLTAWVNTRPPYLSFLKNLYTGQEATVRNRHGTTDWFKIGKGIRQVCTLSPWLFNFCAEYIFSIPRPTCRTYSLSGAPGSFTCRAMPRVTEKEWNALHFFSGRLLSTYRSWRCDGHAFQIICIIPGSFGIPSEIFRLHSEDYCSPALERPSKN